MFIQNFTVESTQCFWRELKLICIFYLLLNTQRIDVNKQNSIQKLINTSILISVINFINNK